ncbi:hypothetical protein MMC26_005260 [Xylographa opegraphella]|nr:hypothetical protein [Xylographa opegraphella]
MAWSRLAIMFSILVQYVLTLPTSLTSRQSSTVPSYVIDYAPLVWLYSTEQYMPGDIGAQLVNTRPEINFSVVADVPTPLTLDNLNDLNAFAPSSGEIYLTSIDDITTNPPWLNGVKPDSTGKTDGARSCAIVVNDHGSGLVDAYYMYFYPFNLGNTVFGMVIGDHVGDWEHNMIRFQDGLPQAMWFSQHSFGEAFTYNAVEKQGRRPISYSAVGSHANYAITGTHDHTIPGVNLPFPLLLEDHCDQGTLWDPTLSSYTYAYNAATAVFTPYVAGTPTNWLYYTGAWGDEQYPQSDPRQKEILGISLTAKYQSGPTGPEDKQLNRMAVCPTGERCVVSPVLTARKA